MSQQQNEFGYPTIESLRDVFEKIVQSARPMSIRRFNGRPEFEDLRKHLKQILDEYESAMSAYTVMVEQTARGALDARIKRFCENLGIGTGTALSLLHEAEMHLQAITQDVYHTVMDYSNDIRDDLVGGFEALEEECCDGA